MLIKLYKTNFFLLMASTLMLTQCTNAINTQEQPVPVIVKKKLASPYKLPTATYLSMANKEEGIKKQDLLLLAAGRMISEGQWRQVTGILAQTNDLTAAQRNEKELLLAKIDAISNKPQKVIMKLANINEPDSLSQYHQIQFHDLLAQSHQIIGNPIKSVNERIKLESLLVENETINNNRRALWLSLLNIPEADLNTLAENAVKESELQGWLQLAMISRKYSNDSYSLFNSIKKWQSLFSHHTANYFLPNINNITNKMLTQPKQIALLLPLTGSLAGPGNAIREGFMAAYKTNNADAISKVKMYDTVTEDVAILYNRAVSEGADYVIGPLIKNQVTTVAAMDHPVPTLLLNDSGVDVQENSYLLGLSPVNEAIQVATQARSKGYTRALIIAPKNDWGNEITKAFSKQWQAENGTVSDIFQYDSNDDLNKKMRDFLHVSDSQEREKQLKELIGNKLQTSTSRRQDFDMIFLLGYPSKARQIMPLLKYYYTGDIPVYATSSVYSGHANSLKDKDLDGVIFCDIPWVFAHQMGEKNWPEQFNSYNRLYALGMDSYSLANQLNQLLLFPAEHFKETNGSFYLKPSQQVARFYEWGQFRHGLVHSLAHVT